VCHISRGRHLLTVFHIHIFRCYDITELSHRSLVNCISYERQAKFTNPQILNFHGIMKSTERHTVDTQITDWADYTSLQILTFKKYSSRKVLFLLIFIC
jgi:hypothetical protein